jgi:hypothetical protein
MKPTSLAQKRDREGKVSENVLQEQIEKQIPNNHIFKTFSIKTISSKQIEIAWLERHSQLNEKYTFKLQISFSESLITVGFWEIILLDSANSDEINYKEQIINDNFPLNLAHKIAGPNQIGVICHQISTIQTYSMENILNTIHQARQFFDWRWNGELDKSEPEPDITEDGEGIFIASPELKQALNHFL